MILFLWAALIWVFLLQEGCESVSFCAFHVGFKGNVGNSSAQDFALAAKSVKTCKLGQKNLPLAEGDLEWADSVTGKPKAELLRMRMQ